VDASIGMTGTRANTDVDVDDLRNWIDGWLGRLADERQGRQEERRRAFVDGAIDALLGLRRQFCHGPVEGPAVQATAARLLARPHQPGRARQAGATAG
jgi:hypothetical protein